jgi:hypothetical protein
MVHLKGGSSKGVVACDRHAGAHGKDENMINMLVFPEVARVVDGAFDEAHIPDTFEPASFGELAVMDSENLVER